MDRNELTQPLSQKKLPQWLITVTPFSKILAMILFILFPIIGFVLGMGYQENKITILPTPIKQTTSSQEKVCKYYGEISKDLYLTQYTVNKGDTLLSIAKNVLGDPSKVNEIITLNKDNYPELSLSKPFLEQGWKLYLPKSFIHQVTDNITTWSGPIANVVNNQMLVIQALPSKGNSGTNNVYLTTDTTYENDDKSLIKIGKCINVVMNGIYAIYIFPQ